MYPHQYGSLHTPLLRPATITKKGVELGCVIMLHTAGGHGAQVVGDSQFSEIETGIKYCPGMEPSLPYYIYRETRAHSSNVWPDRVRYVTHTHTAWNNSELR